MRITADVILRAQVTINPLRERELNLRGTRVRLCLCLSVSVILPPPLSCYLVTPSDPLLVGLKAPAIENLGVTKDGFDCIDLSDNEIKKLENFPRLRRLRMLLLHNNHIAKFQDNLAESIANLEYLILTGNKIASLAELDRLACFAKLDTLALGGNPVTKRKYYREYVIHKLPQLKVLDFKKIKPHDREAAKVLFNSLAGQRIEQEARQENGSESAVASSAQEMEKVHIAPPTLPKPAAAVAVAVTPPPPPPAAPVVPVAAPVASPVKQSPKKEARSSVKAEHKPVTPAKQQEQVSEPEEKAVAPSTPPRAVSVSTKREDVDMEDADKSNTPAAPTVPFTPSKPIEQMTVAALREELKQRGLSIKGLKAELVQRLKDATGA